MNNETRYRMIRAQDYLDLVASRREARRSERLEAFLVSVYAGSTLAFLVSLVLYL